MARQWPDGQLPNRLYVVTDGLNTRSESSSLAPGYVPWREVLTSPVPGPPPFDGLRGIDPPAVVRGFSYNAPGFHYERVHFAQSLDALANAFAAGYAPLPCLPAVYLGFSLGAVVTVLGLEAWLAGRGPATNGGIEAVVLVQPALRVAPSYARFVKPPLYELVWWADEPEAPGSHPFGRVVRAVAAMAQTRGIPIYLLYWPGDEVIPYHLALPDERGDAPAVLERAGARVYRLPAPLAFKEGQSDPFRQHAAIASHPLLLAALQDLLRSIIA